MESTNFSNIALQVDQQLNQYNSNNMLQIKTIKTAFKDIRNKYGLIKAFYFETTPEDYLSFGQDENVDNLCRDQQFQDLLFVQQILDPKEIDIFCKSTADLYSVLNQDDPNLTSCLIVGNGIVICRIFFIPYNSILYLKQINPSTFKTYLFLSLCQDILLYDYSKIIRLMNSVKWVLTSDQQQIQYFNNSQLQLLYGRNKSILKLFDWFSISSIMVGEKIVLFSNRKDYEINQILQNFIYGKPITLPSKLEKNKQSIKSSIQKEIIDLTKQQTMSQPYMQFGIIEQKKIYIQNTNQTIDAFMWIHPDFIVTNFIQFFNTLSYSQKFVITEKNKQQVLKLKMQHDVNALLFHYYLNIFERNVPLPTQGNIKQLLITNPQTYTDCIIQQQTSFSKIYQTQPV